MMDATDESSDERHHDGNVDGDCDHKRLLLKKNLSWTNSNSINSNSLAKSNSLKTSRSNPHVLDAVTSSVKSIAASKLKLATSQLSPNHFQSQTIPFHDDHKVAPLTKAISASTLTAATTHQTLATPTSIQLNIRPKPDLKFRCRAILRHCKVNTSLVVN